MKRTKRRKGRPRVGGAPISITLTAEQLAWLDAMIPPGGTRTATVRAIIQRALETERPAPEPAKAG